MISRAVILAGGFGTRLRPLTFTRPKPLLPLVDKPVLEHIVQYLKAHGIKNITITTNYMREMIIEHLSKCEVAKDLRFSYPEEPEPLGTAGSVKNAGLDETSVIIQGDNITDINLRELIKFHKKHGRLATIALMRVDDPYHYGIVEIGEEGIVKRFKEKPRPEECFSNLINTGLYVIEPEVLKYVPERRPFDFSKDLFPILVQEGELYGCEVEGFWVDVGKPDGYMRAVAWLLKKLASNTAAPAIADDAKLQNTEIRGEVFVDEGAVVSNATIYGPTVIGEGAVVESAELHASVLFEKSEIASAYVERSIIGESSMIRGGARITDSVIGPYCSIHDAVLDRGSKVWPFVNLPYGSKLKGELRRFVRFEYAHKPEAAKNRLLRRVSEEEAFYFNLQDYDGTIRHTGFVAYSIEELIEILKTIDERSIKYHLRNDANDFAEWIIHIFGERELAEEIRSVKGERARTVLIDILRRHLAAAVREGAVEANAKVRGSTPKAS